MAQPLLVTGSLFVFFLCVQAESETVFACMINEEIGEERRVKKKNRRKKKKKTREDIYRGGGRETVVKILHH